ncbi:hypothetical protein Nmel_017438 [Mimus melanotis]
MEIVTDSPQDPNPEGHFHPRCFADEPGGGPGGAATPSPTVGVEFYSWTILMPPSGKASCNSGTWLTRNSSVSLEVLLGMPRSITRSFYQSAVGVLLMFDLTNRASFDHIPECYAMLQETGCLPLSWWDTSVTWSLSQPCQQRKPDTLLPPWTSAHSNLTVELAFQTLAGGIQQALGQGILAPHQGCDGNRLIPNQSRRQPLAGRVPWERCLC